MSLLQDVLDTRDDRSSPRPPRRVLMTVDAVGGVWRYALDLSCALQESGIRVALIGFGPAPSHAQREGADAGQLRLFWRDLPLDWMPGGLAALPAIAEAVARAADAFKADLVHLNTVAYAGRRPSLPTIAVAHSCIPTWWRAVRGGEVPADFLPHKRANEIGLRTADCVVAPSQSHARSIRSVYGHDFDLRVIHNASRPAPARRRRRDKIVFAAARWWDDAKNAHTLDEAARLTRWPVVMAGALDDPGGRRQQISHARAPGALDADTTREWMRRASAFVAPSIYEPFGLAVLEAAWAGTPLVLADIATFRELWDGAALFASPYEPAAFAIAIDQLMTDSELRRRLARRARQRASRFTLDKQVEEMLAAYTAAIGAGAHALRNGA